MPKSPSAQDGELRFGCPLWWLLYSRLQVAIGRLLVRHRVPGRVADTVYFDQYTGDRVEVRNRPLFVVFSINDRDYYFDRFTGHFDGTGYVDRSQCRLSQSFGYRRSVFPVAGPPRVRRCSGKVRRSSALGPRG